MSDYLSNLEWFYHHCTQFHYILETNVPIYDVAKFIMEYIIKLDTLFVSNKVKADLFLESTPNPKSSAEKLHMYVELIAILLMQFVQDDNFSVGRLKALHESTVPPSESGFPWEFLHAKQCTSALSSCV